MHQQQAERVVAASHQNNREAGHRYVKLKLFTFIRNPGKVGVHFPVREKSMNLNTEKAGNCTQKL